MRSSTRRATLAVCAALLLVTAGCSGGTNPTSTAPSVTSTDSRATNSTTSSTPATTTTGTWSPNASVDQYPPGVAANGTLANVTTLLDAHFDATANQSVELTVEWSAPNRSFVRTYTHGPNRTPYYSTYTDRAAEERVTQEFYGTDERNYFRVTLPNTSVTRVLQNVTVGSATWTRESVNSPRDSLEYFLDRGNYSVNGTVDHGGQTFVQLSADDGTSGFGESYAAYDGRVLVTPDGVVHDVHESFGTGTNGSVDERYEGAGAVDTDVEWTGPPSWVAATPQLSLSIVEDGRAVEIRNTGGVALAGNATFEVNADDEPVQSRTPRSLIRGEVSGTVTTDGPLAPGEAVYVTAGADGAASSFALHDDPPTGEYTFGAVGVRSDHENVVYRLQTGFETTWNDDEEN